MQQGIVELKQRATGERGPISRPKPSSNASRSCPMGFAG